MDPTVPLFNDFDNLVLLLHLLATLPAWFWAYALAALVDWVVWRHPPWGHVMLALAALLLGH